MQTIDYSSVSFQYACQILGVDVVEQLPSGLKDKIYWTLKGIHRIRVKELSLEMVASFCQPYLQEKIEKAQADSIKSSAAVKRVREKTNKASKAKSESVRKIKTEQLKLDKQGQ